MMYVLKKVTTVCLDVQMVERLNLILLCHFFIPFHVCLLLQVFLHKITVTLTGRRIASCTHLSKGRSGLKQKHTQTPTSFLGLFFHALSHDVIHFALRVSSKNLEMEVSDWLLKNFNQ